MWLGRTVQVLSGEFLLFLGCEDFSLEITGSRSLLLSLLYIGGKLFLHLSLKASCKVFFFACLFFLTPAGSFHELECT